MVESGTDQQAQLRFILQELEASGVHDPEQRLQTAQKILQSAEAVPAALEADARGRALAAMRQAGLSAEPRDLDFSENALVVLEKRYLLPGERPEKMLRRVAHAIAEADHLYDPKANVAATEAAFYQAMARLEFLPNSPTLMNAGTGAGTLSACFVLGLEDSMEAIMETAKQAAMVQKYGGGTGFSLSLIRPKGAPIATTHGKACGPIAVLRHLSSVSTLVTQGGKRDGANMAVMDIRHPDILEFITAKEQEGQVHNFNISVGVDDAFMQAVERGEDYDLLDPRTGKPVGRLNAREVFERVVAGAWRNGEPGMVFLDTVNRDNPTPHLGRITATNPCGEQPLLPYESCNLGSINLARMVREDGDGFEIDWEKLRQTVHLAAHFLDNVIDANRYSVPEIERITKATRKIGLGVMGFADMLVRLGIPYDSEEGLETGRQVMRFIRQEADVKSIELARTRGVFPAFKGSRYDQPGMPQVRNACRMTVAPTGTISMIAGCSSGIEPLFALAFRKHNILEGQTLYYVDAAFEAVSHHEGCYSEALMEYLADGKSLQKREDVPAWVRRTFVTAPDIAPEWHVRMQAAFQESTDAAISKTINFPNQATQEDVRKTYLLAWKLGCKGITVYRAGSREKEVLTAGTKEGAKTGAPAPDILVPRERPQTVRGVTERVRTGHGNMYVTVNFDDEGRPFEVFTVLGKAGGDESAHLEAVARLVSMALRAGVAPESVIEQLRGITCPHPAWEAGVLVSSAADALAIALSRAIGREGGRPVATQPPLIAREAFTGGERQPLAAAVGKAEPPGLPQGASAYRGSGDGHPNWGRCPECSGVLVFQEGCLMCHECGYNKCG